MVVDNYRAADGYMARLRVLGFNCITNEEVASAIKAAYFANLQRRVETMDTVDNIVFYYGETGWNELWTGNVLLQGVQKLLEDYEAELGGAFVARVALGGLMVPDYGPVFHMVVHLAR
ncbi:hypothetical protein GGR56DRAFT_669821 [Xylariaceae sp. FL0804]|nr:hypothetical protein GGR56DRAFT_669821 [Xylariaceae sp. FL0804]